MTRNVILTLVACAALRVTAFTPTPHHVRSRELTSQSRAFLDSARYAQSKKSWSDRDRDEILDRNGEYFKMDRMRGTIEFGSSDNLVTSLDGADEASVRRWLSNDRAVAMSIWDEKLIEELSPSVYRLKLMSLMFVTIQLSPHVDVRMFTVDTPSGPVFKLESVAFEPNIQILPGIGVSAASFGILIDVVGELRPTKNGKGVEGRIGFVTSGKLSPPMRILPEQAIKSSLGTINRTINNFAVDSFRKGSRAKFREFLRSEPK